MLNIKQDAETAARSCNIVELFEVRSTFQAEIERRGKEALIAIGYNPYRWSSVMVALSKRGKVDIITVTAEFEQNHEEHRISHEFPSAQFTLLLQRDNYVPGV